MAKLNAKYEVLYIIDPSLSEEATAELVAKFKALVESKGTVTEVDEWGKRKLAYPINDIEEGYYVLMTFTATPDLPHEMDRQMRINSSIMRSLITLKAE